MPNCNNTRVAKMCKINADHIRTRIIQIFFGKLTLSNSSVPEVSVLAAERTWKVGGGRCNAHCPTLCQRLYVLGSGQLTVIFLCFKAVFPMPILPSLSIFISVRRQCQL